MHARAPSDSDASAQDPWFVRRQGLALVVALLLFVGVTALRFAAGNDPAVGITMLYVMPISLVALARGATWGIAAGLLGTALFLVWSRAVGVEAEAAAWLSRGVPFVLAGYLLGDAADRLRRANEARLSHEAAELRHRQAVEVNDLLVQGMVAAKWSFEAGRTESGLKTLEETLELGQDMVSRLIRDAGGAGRVMDG